jgi:hypothetical protein
MMYMLWLGGFRYVIGRREVMAVRDPKTEWLRVQIYRKMTPQQRIMIAAQLYEDGISILRASILDRYPDLTPEALQREVRRRLLSRVEFQQVEAYLQTRRQYGAAKHSTPSD